MSGPRPVAAVARLQAYKPPRHPAPIDLYLAGNEGDSPPAELLDAIAGREVETLRSYPDASGLTQDIADRHGLNPDQVLVAAGGDEAIDRLCRAYVEKGAQVVLPVPTFVMFAHYLGLADATIVEVPWPDGVFPTEAVCSRCSAATAMAIVVSPNNPTGSVATADDLRRVAAAAPNAVLIVDCAYTEYADDDLTAAALELHNAVVIRTVSKAYGLAGLRVGYALGQAELLAPVRTAGGPFSVAGPSLALAAHALQNHDDRAQAHIARVREERTALRQQLIQLGASVTESHANFVLPRLRDPVWLRDGLAGLGIAVRTFPDTAHLEDAARITCPGTEAGIKRLSHGLRATLAPQTVLFDMDGVLADVSQSYRKAIIAAAASFGVKVSASDIHAVKARGNANNDWEVTLGLVRAAGIEADLDTVTERFEELYQGTEAAPGLWRNETLLTSPALLARLAERLPLGVVTGRPRADAERLLVHFDIGRYFGAVVCMEDGPLKPDPAPVRLGLERLGVTAGWMVGDTPDDLRAARAAGVVPLAICAPGETNETNAHQLLATGAARVLASIDELETLLP